MATSNLNSVHSFFGASMNDKATFWYHHIFGQNHSCEPNCAPNAVYINEANIDKPLVTLFTRRDVLPWEELCFSYTGYDTDDEVCLPSGHLLWLQLYYRMRSRKMYVETTAMPFTQNVYVEPRGVQDMCLNEPLISCRSCVMILCGLEQSE